MSEQLNQDPLSATRIFDRRKNPDAPVTRDDMSTLVGKINERFDQHAEVLTRVDKALFYKPTDENDETPPGIVPMLRKIDNHVDVMCGFAKWFARALSWGVPLVCAVLGVLGQFKGWW